MAKVKHYLGIDFTTKESTEISNKGVKEVIDNLQEQLIEMANEFIKTKKPIIGIITIEYGTEDYWKIMNNKNEF